MTPATGTTERWSGLALPPVLATALFYVLPASLQEQLLIQFIPQVLAYAAMAVWAAHNTHLVTRLGLERPRLKQGVAWGLPTGLILGWVNVSVILYLVPFLGGDIAFLRETPHAQLPTALMLPWLILLIAVFVELNFRGFILGRLLALSTTALLPPRLGPVLAVGISALMFAFDPFMVETFKHLHWIAVWDGLVWGIMWLYLRNLYATIAAHAVEVIVMYSVLKVVLP